MSQANADASAESSSISTSSTTAALNGLEQVYAFATETSSEITIIKVQGDEVLDATKQRPNI
jgi:hypothetical protein